MSARPIESLELSEYSGFNRKIHNLQRELLQPEGYDLRQQFHTEWKERFAIYLDGGMDFSEAMIKAIHEIRDKWLS